MLFNDGPCSSFTWIDHIRSHLTFFLVMFIIVRFSHKYLITFCSGNTQSFLILCQHNFDTFQHSYISGQLFALSYTSQHFHVSGDSLRLSNWEKYSLRLYYSLQIVDTLFRLFEECFSKIQYVHTSIFSTKHKNYLQISSVSIFPLWFCTKASFNPDGYGSEVPILKLKYLRNYMLKKTPKNWTYCVLELEYIANEFTAFWKVPVLLANVEVTWRKMLFIYSTKCIDEFRSQYSFLPRGGGE